MSLVVGTMQWFFGRSIFFVSMSRDIHLSDRIHRMDTSCLNLFEWTLLQMQNTILVSTMHLAWFWQRRPEKSCE